MVTPVFQAGLQIWIILLDKSCLCMENAVNLEDQPNEGRKERASRSLNRSRYP